MIQLGLAVVQGEHAVGLVEAAPERVGGGAVQLHPLHGSACSGDGEVGGAVGVEQVEFALLGDADGGQAVSHGDGNGIFIGRPVLATGPQQQLVAAVGDGLGGLDGELPVLLGVDCLKPGGGGLLVAPGRRTVFVEGNLGTVHGVPIALGEQGARALKAVAVQGEGSDCQLGGIIPDRNGELAFQLGGIRGGGGELAAAGGPRLHGDGDGAVSIGGDGGHPGIADAPFQQSVAGGHRVSKGVHQLGLNDKAQGLAGNQVALHKHVESVRGFEIARDKADAVGFLGNELQRRQRGGLTFDVEADPPALGVVFQGGGDGDGAGAASGGNHAVFVHGGDVFLALGDGEGEHPGIHSHGFVQGVNLHGGAARLHQPAFRHLGGEGKAAAGGAQDGAFVFIGKPENGFGLVIAQQPILPAVGGAVISPQGLAAKVLLADLPGAALEEHGGIQAGFGESVVFNLLHIRAQNDGLHIAQIVKHMAAQGGDPGLHHQRADPGGQAAPGELPLIVQRNASAAVEPQLAALMQHPADAAEAGLRLPGVLGVGDAAAQNPAAVGEGNGNQAAVAGGIQLAEGARERNGGVGAAGKGVAADLCIRRDGDLGQLFAACEGIGGYPAGYGQLGNQAVAALQPEAVGNDAQGVGPGVLKINGAPAVQVGNDHPLHGAEGKGILPDGCEGAREAKLAQLGAALEGPAFNPFQFLRQGDLGQGGAALEGLGTDLGDGVRQLEGFHCGAARESQIAHPGDALADGDSLDIGFESIPGGVGGLGIVLHASLATEIEASAGGQGPAAVFHAAGGGEHPLLGGDLVPRAEEGQEFEDAAVKQESRFGIGAEFLPSGLLQSAGQNHRLDGRALSKAAGGNDGQAAGKGDGLQSGAAGEDTLPQAAQIGGGHAPQPGQTGKGAAADSGDPRFQGHGGDIHFRPQGAGVGGDGTAAENFQCAALADGPEQIIRKPSGGQGRGVHDLPVKGAAVVQPFGIGPLGGGGIGSQCLHARKGILGDGGYAAAEIQIFQSAAVGKGPGGYGGHRFQPDFRQAAVLESALTQGELTLGQGGGFQGAAVLEGTGADDGYIVRNGNPGQLGQTGKGVVADPGDLGVQTDT